VREFSTSIDIDAPPEIVFEHLTTPAGMVAWMGQHAELRPEPGGRFSVDIDGAAVRGEYLEVQAPTRVVVSWGMAGSEDLPPGSSRVEFTLTATANGTHLELRHTGLPDARVDGHTRGWARFLTALRDVATRSVSYREDRP
jgi:uncharacterized protein YndB with AHSA1/START domain